MDANVRSTVRWTGLASAALGVVLSPVPLADELLLAPVYGLMTLRIAKHHGLAVRRIPWSPIATTTLAGLMARAAVNVTVSYIPGVAAAANAVSAVALTRALGRYIDGVCADPGGARPLTARALFAQIRRASSSAAA